MVKTTNRGALDAPKPAPDVAMQFHFYFILLSQHVLPTLDNNPLLYKTSNSLLVVLQAYKVCIFFSDFHGSFHYKR